MPSHPQQRMPDDNGSHHARDDTANDTRYVTASTTDQDIGEYNYVLSTLAEYCTGGTSSRDESFSYSLVNL